VYGFPAPPPTHTPGKAAAIVNAELMDATMNGNSGAGLRNADVDRITHLLRLVAESRVRPEDLLGGARDVRHALVSVVQNEPDLLWRECNVTSPSAPEVTVTVYFRPVDEVLHRYAKELPLTWGFEEPTYTSKGNRIYSSFASGVLMEDTCKLFAALSPGSTPMPMSLWSDKGNINWRGSVEYHPVDVVPRNLSIETWRKVWRNAQVALIPIVKQDDYPDMTDSLFKRVKAELFTASFIAILGNAFNLDTCSFTCMCADNIERHVIPFVSDFLCDHPEMLELMGLIDKTLCGLCNVRTVLALEDATQADGDDAMGSSSYDSDHLVRATVESRTYAALVKGNASVEAALASGVSSRFAAARKDTRQQGNESVAMFLYKTGPFILLADRGKDIHPGSFFPPCVLHVFDEGWSKIIIQSCITKHLDLLYGKPFGLWLTRTATLRLKTIVDVAGVEWLRLPNLNRVFRGSPKSKGELGCGKLQAYEMRALWQLMPFAAAGLLGEMDATKGEWVQMKSSKDYLLELCSAYASFYVVLKRYNQPAGHTNESLQALKVLGDRVTITLQRYFNESCNLQRPKQHSGFGPHLPQFIRDLGSVDNFSTECGENSIQGVKKAYVATNKHDHCENQIALTLALRQAASRHISGTLPPAAAAATKCTASSEAEDHGENFLARGTVAWVEMASFDTDSNIHLTTERGRDVFHRELTLWLDENEGATVSKVGVVHTAVICARRPHQPAEYALHELERVYAAPKHYGKPHYSFVCVKGRRSADAPVEEWIGQLLFLFRLPASHGNKELAFVQYLTLAEECNKAGESPLADTPGCAVLKWERSARGGLSYAVVELHDVIRREYLVPDVSTLFAPKRPAVLEKNKRKAAKKARRTEYVSDSDVDESDEEDTCAEGGQVNTWRPEYFYRNPFTFIRERSVEALMEE